MKRKDRNVDLRALMQELSLAELMRARQMVASDASHCRPMSCIITGCAILCDSMSCPDFEYACGPNCQLLKGCGALLRCTGFSGKPDGCSAFVAG